MLDALAGNPRVIGIKESSGNLLRALEINKRYAGDYQLSCGSDDQAFDFFLWGATSWICGPANCLVESCVKFYNAFTSGDLKKAQAIAKRLETSDEYVSPGEMAILYGALGERDRAMAWLEKAYTAHDLQLQFIGVDTAFDPVRHDPRFQDLMRRIGLID